MAGDVIGQTGLTVDDNIQRYDGDDDGRARRGNFVMTTSNQYAEWRFDLTYFHISLVITSVLTLITTGHRAIISQRLLF